MQGEAAGVGKRGGAPLAPRGGREHEGRVVAGQRGRPRRHVGVARARAVRRRPQPDVLRRRHRHPVLSIHQDPRAPLRTRGRVRRQQRLRAPARALHPPQRDERVDVRVHGVGVRQRRQRRARRVVQGARAPVTRLLLCRRRR